MKSLEKLLALGMLLFAIGFNLWLYRLEPTSAVDPNDNAFQYALVLRTNEIWDYADRTCPSFFVSRITCHVSLLVDHWVPYWAEGYNLPYYYSHVPQIIIVGTYRLFSPLMSNVKCSAVAKVLEDRQMSNQFNNATNQQCNNISLFEYYHWIIYLLLCFFPLSIFISLSLLLAPRSLGEGGSRPCLPAGRSSWLTAGIGALLASHISTDGLYGIDPASFLWRGWGLSSQLFAMVFMPLALVYSIRFINDRLSVFRFRFSDKSLSVVGQSGIKTDKLKTGKHESDNRQLKTDNRCYISPSLLPAIIFITLTTMGHLGMGMMLFLAIPVIAFTQPFLSFLHQQSIKIIWKESQEALFKVILLALPPLILLSYWIVPTVLHSAYHNISFWDSVWKFNSYGARQVLTNLFNGNLFDFGRPPIMTVLVFIGMAIAVSAWKNKECGIRTSDGEICASGPALSFLFLFFLLLYFGRTTWGNVLNIIPGMDEFHQHRFIVGVHLMGLFLAPIGITWIIETTYSAFRLRYKQFNNAAMKQLFYCSIATLLLLVILPPIYKQTVNYGTYNATLIEKANTNFGAIKQDVDELVQTLKNLPPGRIFSGRGGGWGRNFRVAETAYYMFLSTYGFPTVLWMPQTWSPNADTEQYFSENSPASYELYNIRYVLTPVDTQPQPFWKFLKETNTWKLYEVGQSQNSSVAKSQNSIITKPSSINAVPAGRQDERSTMNYITAGSSPSVIFSDKRSFKNLVQLWIQSTYPERYIFPELRIKNKITMKQLNNVTIPRFSMLDEANYLTPDGKTHSLFAEPPKYVTPWEMPEAFPQYYKSDKSTNPTNQFNNEPMKQLNNVIEITNQSSDTDMVFKAKVEIKEKCPTCTVVLKQTYHPNWRATVNGKSVKPIAVFPFYTAVRLEEPGEYEVTFAYTPSRFKMLLLFGGIGIAIVLFYMTVKKWR